MQRNILIKSRKNFSCYKGIYRERHGIIILWYCLNLSCTAKIITRAYLLYNHLQKFPPSSFPMATENPKFDKKGPKEGKCQCVH